MPATTRQPHESDAPPSLPPRVSLLGAEVDAITLPRAVDHIMASLATGKGGWVITPNLDILRRLVVDRDFAQLASGTTLRLPDGMPLVWASRLQKTPIPERVAGSDLIWSLTNAAADHGRSVYLFGGNPGAAEAAASRFRELHPTLKIAGAECPQLGFESDETYMRNLEQRLIAVSPDIMYVALGCPKQERVAARLRLSLPRTWFLGVGISFSFVSGEVKRAPAWMRKAGLEWFHRMMQEPGRLAKRYLVDGLPFAARLFWVSWLRGWRSNAV